MSWVLWFSGVVTAASNLYDRESEKTRQEHFKTENEGGRNRHRRLIRELFDLLTYTPWFVTYDSGCSSPPFVLSRFDRVRTWNVIRTPRIQRPWTFRVYNKLIRNCYGLVSSLHASDFLALSFLLFWVLSQSVVFSENEKLTFGRIRNSLSHWFFFYAYMAELKGS